MKIPSRALLVAISMFLGGHSFALTTYSGVGVIRSQGDSRLASVRMLDAGIWSPGSKTAGHIMAELGPAAAEYVKLPGGPDSWKAYSYFPYAKLDVYQRVGNKETLVYSGQMDSRDIVPAIAPPSNEAPRRTPHVFIKAINEPRDPSPLKLGAGRYRAEVTFFMARSTSWGPGVSPATDTPAPIEVAGVAEEFSIGQFFKAPVSSARGEVSITSSYTPKVGASAAQIAALKDAAAAELKRVTSETKSLFDSEGTRVSIAPEPARKPWFYSFTTSTPDRAGTVNSRFLILDGETFSEEGSYLLSRLQRIVSGGNITRTLPGGTYRVSTFTNISLYLYPN